MDGWRHIFVSGVYLRHRPTNPSIEARAAHHYRPFHGKWHRFALYGHLSRKREKIVGIEGISSGPKRARELAVMPPNEKFIDWIDNTRSIAARVPRRYATFEEALGRMQATNKHLSDIQARHLTMHGINQNEDGTYSWKFDNYVRAFTPFGIDQEETQSLWQLITCPALLIRGGDSWAKDPFDLGYPDHFKNAEFVTVEGAGHWVHHDKLDEFLKLVRDFLAD